MEKLLPVSLKPCKKDISIDTDNQTEFFNAVKTTFPDAIKINLRAFQMAYSTLSEDLFEGKAQITVDKMRGVLDELLDQIPKE